MCGSHPVHGQHLLVAALLPEPAPMGAVTPTPGLGQTDPCSPLCRQHKAVSSQERLGGSLKTCPCLLERSSSRRAWCSLSRTPLPQPRVLTALGARSPTLPAQCLVGFPVPRLYYVLTLPQTRREARGAGPSRVPAASQQFWGLWGQPKLGTSLPSLCFAW